MCPEHPNFSELALQPRPALSAARLWDNTDVARCSQPRFSLETGGRVQECAEGMLGLGVLQFGSALVTRTDHREEQTLDCSCSTYIAYCIKDLGM